MRKIVSIAWLRVERASDFTLDLIPGGLLIAGGLLVMSVGTLR